MMPYMNSGNMWQLLQKFHDDPGRCGKHLCWERLGAPYGMSFAARPHEHRVLVAIR